MLASVDVERTMEFILKSQARAEVRMDKLDKGLTGISKLLGQGMRMLAQTNTTVAQLAQAQKRTETRLSELAQTVSDLSHSVSELSDAQKATERSLKAFINSLRHRRNGQDGR